MTRVLLVRHGRTTANASGILAGRTPGVELDSVGVDQATTLGWQLREVPLTHIVSSPLERTVATARLIRKELTRDTVSAIVKDKNVNECDYGDWSGKKLKRLARDPLWMAVQAHPSSVQFPNGESLLAAQTRAVGAVHGWAKLAAAEAGSRAIVLIVTHADIIKSVLADALGMHLDMFQRLVIDPGSISAIDYTSLRPFVSLVNGSESVGASVSRGITPSSDAAVGGGAGRRGPRK